MRVCCLVMFVVCLLAPSDSFAGGLGAFLVPGSAFRAVSSDSFVGRMRGVWLGQGMSGQHIHFTGKGWLSQRQPGSRVDGVGRGPVFEQSQGNDGVVSALTAGVLVFGVASLVAIFLDIRALGARFPRDTAVVFGYVGLGVGVVAMTLGGVFMGVTYGLGIAFIAGLVFGLPVIVLGLAAAILGGFALLRGYGPGRDAKRVSLDFSGMGPTARGLTLRF